MQLSTEPVILCKTGQPSFSSIDAPTNAKSWGVSKNRIHYNLVSGVKLLLNKWFNRQCLPWHNNPLQYIGPSKSISKNQINAAPFAKLSKYDWTLYVESWGTTTAFGHELWSKRYLNQSSSSLELQRQCMLETKPCDVDLLTRAVQKLMHNSCEDLTNLWYFRNDQDILINLLAKVHALPLLAILTKWILSDLVLSPSLIINTNVQSY